MPRSYDECVDRILRYCEKSSELEKMPWLVNTMGFTNGLGAKVNTTKTNFRSLESWLGLFLNVPKL